MSFRTRAPLRWGFSLREFAQTAVVHVKIGQEAQQRFRIDNEDRVFLRFSYGLPTVPVPVTVGDLRDASRKLFSKSYIWHFVEVSTG